MAEETAEPQRPTSVLHAYIPHHLTDLQAKAVLEDERKLREQWRA